MNGELINDQRVRVEIAGQPKKPKGPQPDDICRLCGRKGHWYLQNYIGKMIVRIFEETGNTNFIKENEEEDPTVHHRLQVLLHHLRLLKRKSR